LQHTDICQLAGFGCGGGTNPRPCFVPRRDSHGIACVQLYNYFLLISFIKINDWVKIIWFSILQTKKKKRGKRNKTLLACFYTTSGLSCLQVSHDEHLISGSVDELWVVSQGRVTPFHGTFLDYKKILQSSWIYSVWVLN
jgi:hypothetical protein